MNEYKYYIKNFLENIGIKESTETFIEVGIWLAISLIVSIIAFFIAKKIILGILKKFVKTTKTEWDDILVQKHVFDRFSYIIAALVFYLLSDVVFHEFETLAKLTKIIVSVYAVIISTLVADSFLNATDEIYKNYEISKTRPIKGYIQVFKIILFITAFIISISILLNKSPLYFLGGLAGLTAVLLLVFKDSLLGLVAGIQLSANDMVRIGDWVSMPKHQTDGTVIDIALTTVKVQNWDKTISMVPSYTLISESFQNWRGMEESPGRRIKRAINIDMTSIRFCTDEMVEKFNKFQLISNYLKERKEKIDLYNQKHSVDTSELINGRRMTNIGCFRAYIESYLKQNPNINKEMTFLIRQLSPDKDGLPIEIYVFSKVKDWVPYEAIQADIFDHLLAAMPQFGLWVFQNPTGRDMHKLIT